MGRQKWCIFSLAPRFEAARLSLCPADVCISGYGRTRENSKANAPLGQAAWTHLLPLSAFGIIHMAFNTSYFLNCFLFVSADLYSTTVAKNKRKRSSKTQKGKRKVPYHNEGVCCGNNEMQAEQCFTNHHWRTALENALVTLPSKVPQRAFVIYAGNASALLPLNIKRDLQMRSAKKQKSNREELLLDHWLVIMTPCDLWENQPCPQKGGGSSQCGLSVKRER